MWRKGNLGRRKLIILNSIIQQGWGTSKLYVSLRILGVAPKVDEKGVAVGEKAASLLIPLQPPAKMATYIDWSRAQG